MKPRESAGNFRIYVTFGLNETNVSLGHGTLAFWQAAANILVFSMMMTFAFQGL
jgi:hypothetical protein